MAQKNLYFPVKITEVRYTLVLYSILCVMLMAACKKHSNLRGPAGDQGSTGPSGEAGMPGKQVNVAGTGNLVIQSSQWTSPDGIEWRATINTPIITQAVMDSGYVQAFIMRDSEWHGLPYFEGIYFTSFAFAEGKVYLVKVSTHGNQPPQPETATYKITAISK